MWSQKAAGNSIDHIAQMAHETLQKDVTYMSDKIKAVHIDFDWHWILGSGIALCAAIMANTGLNLQKLSHLENSYYDPFTRKRPRPENDKSSMMSRPRWWIGIVLIVMASICDFAALSFAAQSIVCNSWQFEFSCKRIDCAHYCKRKNNKPGMEGYSANYVG